MSSTLFSLPDYEGLLAHLRGAIPLIGGQAAAFWVLRYAPESPCPVSQDIDFLATGEEVRGIAPGAVRELRFPHRRDRTNLSAVGRVDTPAGTSPVEFLHTVPGLDVTVPEVIFSDDRTDVGTPIRVLEPVSLMMTKLFAVRNFDQTDRNDIGHLRAMVPVCNAHLAGLLARDPASAFFHLRRLARWLRPDAQQRSALRHGIPLIDVFPQDLIACHSDPKIAAFGRGQLNRLRDEWRSLTQRFPPARGGGGVQGSPSAHQREELPPP